MPPKRPAAAGGGGTDGGKLGPVGALGGAHAAPGGGVPALSPGPPVGGNGELMHATLAAAVEGNGACSIHFWTMQTLCHGHSVHHVRITISGSSGLIGSALVQRLHDSGHQVIRLVRGTPQPTATPGSSIRWDPSADVLPNEAIEGVDAVINLSGAGIGDHRWTPEYKTELLQSRLRTTGLLARSIAAATAPPAVFLSGSAIGWYGDRGDESLDETSAPGTGFLADVCVQWEAATDPAQSSPVRIVHLRTGIVLSGAGGALKKQLPLFKFGLGGKFGTGRQWQSWISIDDYVSALQFLLIEPLSGAVNLTAPHPVTNAAFTDVLGTVLHRPTVLPIPSFGPKLLLGAELAQALLYTGQRVMPERLVASGFTFAQPELEGALRSLLGR